MTALVKATQDIASALEAAGIPYAIGGAIALGFHATPRATADIDINIFVPGDACRGALEVLAALGVDFEDLAATERSCRERGDGRGYLDRTRVDVFVNSVPLHDLAERRRVRVDLAGTPIWVLSAEDLVVLKLLFDRPKDHVDVRAVIALNLDRLDSVYVRRQLVAHVGADDHRVALFDSLWSITKE